MIRVYRTLSILVLVVTVSGAATAATAADHTPDGTVSMQSTSIAIGIGIDWGKGTLTFKGKHYPFQVGGLKAVGVGVATEHAEGSVYHLEDALEKVPSGSSIAWRNPDSGHAGTVTPTRTYQTAHGQYCQEYQQTIVIGGQQHQSYGTACRQPDGSWQMVN